MPVEKDGFEDLIIGHSSEWNGDDGIVLKDKWFAVYPNSQVLIANTEEEVASLQRFWREIHHRDPMTGEKD